MFNSITITIGRNDNIDGSPLPQDQWDLFKKHITETVERMDFGLNVTSDGQGLIEDTDQQVFTLVALRPEPITDAERDSLEYNLMVFSNFFHQDSINYSTGLSDQAYAKPQQKQKAVA